MVNSMLRTLARLAIGGVAAGAVASLMTGCAGAADGSLTIRLDVDAGKRFRERCSSVADGAAGDLSGVFDQEWDEITFAYPGASYDDIAAETGAVFHDSLAGRKTFEGVIVLQLDGEAVAALAAEQFPYRFADESELIITMSAPGRFVRDGVICVVEDESA
ncbi:hypothetical protein USB125703_01338 [Pseudoclavibacter triregionum]|nr:hypothetical protein USB125703_01338 [Pseudoclavibacter triregionum]